MVGACPRVRDLRTLAESVFERGISTVVNERSGQAGGDRARVWIRARLAAACIALVGWAAPELAAAQARVAAERLPPLMAASAPARVASAAMIGGALVVAQLSGLHDQTQRVVLLAPNLDAYMAGELIRGLATRGVRAMTVREARLDPALEACGTFGCLAQVARASQGRAALASVARSGDGANTLLLVLVAADGSNAQARTRIGAAGIAGALTEAWKETSLSLALAGDSMIHAESRPAGASVWLDGAPAGSTPFARQVSPGAHSVLLRLDGFVAEERAVDAKPGKAQRVQLTLRREPRFDAEELTRTTRPLPSAWNSVLGGALVLAAAPALIASLNALANDGQCLRVREADDNSCNHRAHYGNQSAILFASGFLALSTGATLVLAQPIQ
jgi:hypothetical protein